MTREIISLWSQQAFLKADIYLPFSSYFFYLHLCAGQDRSTPEGVMLIAEEELRVHPQAPLLSPPQEFGVGVRALEPLPEGDTTPLKCKVLGQRHHFRADPLSDPHRCLHLPDLGFNPYTPSLINP